MTPLPDEVKEILDKRAIVHVATIAKDGSPQVTPVWVDREGDVILFNTAAGRAKARNLERDPRVTLSFTDPDDPYRPVSIRGSVEITTEGADEHIDVLAKKYMDLDEYPWRNPEEIRLLVRIIPEAIRTGI